MTRTAIIALAAVAGAASIASPAAAQGYGHGHHAPHHNVCWVEVKTEPVYGTVRRQVVKEPARLELREHAAVYGEVKRRVLVKHGEWEKKVEPAVYEDRERNVLVTPEITHVRFKPPVYKEERVEHKVKDHYGHEKSVWVVKPVLVEPAKRWVEKTAAVYKTVKFKALVKPEQVHQIYHQPVFEERAERVILKPAHVERIWHKPVVDYVEERVVLKEAHAFKKQIVKPHGEKC